MVWRLQPMDSMDFLPDKKVVLIKLYFANDVQLCLDSRGDLLIMQVVTGQRLLKVSSGTSLEFELS